jgi:3-oxoacyl-[acyl-carrier protein] reductase
MKVELTGKHAMVCGSTGGIGFAAAVELASLGARVTLVARDEEKLRSVLGKLPSSGTPHDYIAADFNDSQDLKKKIENYLGKNGPIHILVNNTGGPPGGKVESAKPEEFLAAFNQHLICNHLLVQAVVEGMKKEGYGRIINVISTSVKQPIPNLGVSNTIRGAVANWAKTLSGEMGKFGITVNNVLPGATKTGRLDAIIQSKAEKSGISAEESGSEMLKEIPAGRFGEPEEIAMAIAFLASPAASYINGINLPVDGGRTASL